MIETITEPTHPSRLEKNPNIGIFRDAELPRPYRAAGNSTPIRSRMVCSTFSRKPGRFPSSS